MSRARPNGGVIATSTRRPFQAAGRASRLVPGQVWLILILHLFVVLCQTAIFPNFRSPDERQHVDLIVMVEQGKAWPWPEQGTMPLSEGSSAGGFTSSNRIPDRLHLAEKDIPPREERWSYQEAGGSTVTDAPPNQLIQHPPLYYLAGAAILAVAPGWQDTAFDAVWLALRFWNVALTLALPLILWATARRLGLPDPVPIAAALIPVAIPELTHNESSVNNDNLLITLFALLTLLVVRVLTGDTSRRTALGIGAITSLALLTKGFALLIPAWIGLVYVVAAIRSNRRQAAVSLAIALAASIPGIAWWVRNKVVYGSLQPHGRFTENPELISQYGWSDGGAGWLLRMVERMNTLFFVHDQTGQRLHHGPWKMAVVAAVIFLVGVVATLVFRSLPRTTTVVLVLPLFGLFAIVGKGSWEQFAASQTYAAMQGRYLYGGLAGLGVVVVAAIARLPERIRWFVPLGLLAFAGAMHVVYLGYTVWLFWAPRGNFDLASGRESLAAIYHWYPFPPAVLFLIMLGTVVSAVLTAVALFRMARRRPGDSGQPGTPGSGEPDAGGSKEPDAGGSPESGAGGGAGTPTRAVTADGPLVLQKRPAT